MPKLPKSFVTYVGHSQYLISRANGSVYLTESQMSELSQIGNQTLTIGPMKEVRIGYVGIISILKRYEEFRTIEDEKKKGSE